MTTTASMPRIVITAEIRAMLTSSYSSGIPLKHIAIQLNVCVDTLKRILMREHIAHFDGAKYAVAQKHQTRTWTRPCMVCHSTKPRPHSQYICTPCHESQLDGLPDDHNLDL